MQQSVDHQAYNTPDAVMRDKDLSTPEKLKILEDWKLDANRLLTSSNENMPAEKEDSGDAGELLQEINHAIDYLNRERPSVDH